MQRRWMFVVPIVIALSTAASDRVGSASAGGEPVPFEEASLIVETNATDGDAGLQVFLDHEPWRSISISRPDGKKILDLKTRGVLVDYGLTELFSESSEPPFEEFPFEEFVELFPEGEYTFSGVTIEGERLRSSVTLSHDIPAAPEIMSPTEDATVAATDLVIRWGAGDQPEGVETVAYQVIVEREDPLRVLDVKLPATATELSVPAEFLEPGVEHKVEVLAIDRSGNQTITEVPFVVA